MKILYIHRKKGFGFSFEGLFNTIQKEVSKEFKVINYYQEGTYSILKDAKKVNKIKADLIHITGGYGIIALFLKQKNKTILTIHDLNHLTHDLKGVKKWLYRMIFFSIPFKNSRLITTVSYYSKNNILKYFKINPNKIRVIHNCFSPIFKKNIKEFNKNKPRILFIGTKKNKNLENTIKGLKGIPSQLVIIGKLTQDQINLLNQEGIDYENLVALSEKEIHHQYEIADIVSFISLREGFGIPIIEAQAIGRVVITSDVTSIPEVAGNGAHYVSPANTQQIKMGFTKIINDDLYRNKLIENGFANCEKFHSKKISKKYINLYKEILE